MTKVSATQATTMALGLATVDQVKALSDADLATVYTLVCNRKTTRGKTRDEVVYAILGDLTAFRRRHIKAQWAAIQEAARG